MTQRPQRLSDAEAANTIEALRPHLPMAARKLEGHIATLTADLERARDVLGKKLNDKTLERLTEFQEVCEYGTKEDRELGLAIEHLLRWHGEARAHCRATGGYAKISGAPCEEKCTAPDFNLLHGGHYGAADAILAALAAAGLEVRKLDTLIYTRDALGAHICPKCGSHADVSDAAKQPHGSGG